MKIYFWNLLFLICLFFLPNYNIEDKRRLFGEIHFQNNFNKDTLTLFINGCKIIDQRILTTDKVLGFAGLELSIIDSANKTLMRFENKAVLCDKIQKNFLLSAVINNKRSLLRINLARGKYLGFSKLSDDSLSLNQSRKSFYYY